MNAATMDDELKILTFNVAAFIVLSIFLGLGRSHESDRTAESFVCGDRGRSVRVSPVSGDV